MDLGSANYLMIQSLGVKNFRCFQDLELHDLKTMNVIVGDSASGKTALLEALFICGGMSPELFTRTLSWRGSGKLGTFNATYLESLFKEIFFGFNDSEKVHISLTDSQRGTRWLDISYNVPADRLPLTSQSAETFGIKIPNFIGRVESGKDYNGTFAVNEKGELKCPPPTEPYPMVFLTSQTSFNPEENAKRFSELSRTKKEGPILKKIRDLFPEINNLSVEFHCGTNMIFADVDGLPEKLPVGSISGGLTKYLAILLAIATRPKSAVLIDEIENSFYYSKQPRFMKGIFDLCVEKETQLFVTTHSMEFLKGMLPILKADKHFCLLRLEKSENGSTVKKYGSDKFVSALRHNFEIR